MGRLLISGLTSGITEQRRIRVALKAIKMDLHLLQHTFYYALCVIDLAVFQCMKFVHVADGWTKDRDADICFLAKCVVAIAISRLGDSGIDDHLSGIVQRQLSWSQSHFSEYRSKRGSVKLWHPVQIARELNSARPNYDDPMARMIFHNTSSVRQLRGKNASGQLRREFCELWIGWRARCRTYAGLGRFRTQCAAFVSPARFTFLCTRVPDRDILLFRGHPWVTTSVPELRRNISLGGTG